MKFFSKTKRTKGHMAVCLHDGGISAASVKRTHEGLPEIEWIDFVPVQTASAMRLSLEELAEKSGSAHYTCSNLLTKAEYQLSLLDAPDVPETEWKSAIRWRLKDVLDFPATDATIDVLSIPVHENATGQNSALYVVAARNQVIKERQALFDAANIQLTVIDIPEMAQRNIAALLESPERALALLSFDAQGGLLTITCDGELYVARRMEISALHLESANQEQKRELSERLTVELQRTLDHFERQFRHIVLSRMVLGPMAASAAADLQDYLSASLYVPVEVLSLDSIFNIEKVPDLMRPESQQRHLLTLGAALRVEGSAT
jgi:MSHA biogenesis protein MshI